MRLPLTSQNMNLYRKIGPKLPPIADKGHFTGDQLR
jgi:hypothetical protein